MNKVTQKASPATLTRLCCSIFILLLVTVPVGCQKAPAPAKKSPNGTTDQAAVELARQPVICPLDGSTISTDDAYQRPLAVMIENHPAARPQSGLEKAGLVFEAVAEGGITRFMAIFGHHRSEKIGPVRSAREYFAELAAGFDAIYAHVGGSPTGYSAIHSLGLDSLDELEKETGFWRSKDRRAPHNLYTSSDNLYARAREKGYSAIGEGRPLFSFTEEAPLAERPEVAEIEINFSTEQYRVRYEYDRQENVYRRRHNNQPHLDRTSGQQLSPKNVVVIVATVEPIDSLGRLRMNTVGEGEAFVFRNGVRTPGRWLRNSLSGKLYFLNEANEDISLNIGQTWIEIIDSVSKLSYTQASGTSSED